ncbi:hypothetical protein ACWCWQ_34585 [Streptomyces sp. NPDC001571]
MIPPAACASIAAQLTDRLGADPRLADLVAHDIAAALTRDGWEINNTRHARPVAPRARKAPRVLGVRRLAHEEPRSNLVAALRRRLTRTNGDHTS